jgi:cytochrome c peroxidase
MLPTDLALASDKSFKPWVEKYAKDEALFFTDFSAVCLKLFELGVPFAETTDQSRMTLKPTRTE